MCQIMKAEVMACVKSEIQGFFEDARLSCIEKREV